MVNFAVGKTTVKTDSTAMPSYNLDFIPDEILYQSVKASMEYYHEKIVPKEDIQEDNSHTHCSCKDNDSPVFQKILFKALSLQMVKSEENFDAVNQKLHIYADIFGTTSFLNENTAEGLLIKMQDKLLKDREAKCYLVDTLSDIPFVAAWPYRDWKDKGRASRINRVTIDNFYEMYFEDEFAFKHIGGVLPDVILDVLDDNPQLDFTNKDYHPHTNTSREISIYYYLLWFALRDGFKLNEC